jgi:hypothetical protein
VFALIWLARVQPLKRSELTGMSTYLTLVGVGQAVAFMALTPAPYEIMLVRYVLLALLTLLGLVGLAWRRPSLRPLTICLVVVMAGFNLSDHIALAREYVAAPPRHELELLADELLARGVRYARADYWTAFDIAWQTQERIILSTPPGQMARMARYAHELDKHADQVFDITTEPCSHGTPVVHWYLCPPRPAGHETDSR